MLTNDPRKDAEMMMRAIRASVVATIVFGSVFVWQVISSERTEQRVEQAQRTALTMSAKKQVALEREAALDAAAKAFAEKQAAEREARAHADAAEPAYVETLAPKSSPNG